MGRLETLNTFLLFRQTGDVSDLLIGLRLTLLDGTLFSDPFFL